MDIFQRKRLLGQPGQRGGLRMHCHSWSDAGRRGRRWQVCVVLVMVMTVLVGMVVLVMVVVGFAGSDEWW